MSARKLLSLALAWMVLFAGVAVAPAAAATGNTAGNTAGNLAVSVTQAGNTGEATVAVTGAGNIQNVVVSVSATGDYDGEGEYDYADFGDDGEFTLPAPEQTTFVTVTAVEGDQSASTTVTLRPADQVEEDLPFGLQVAAFVHGLLSDEDRSGGIGHAVAEFVHENNPGNPPAHAGPGNAGNTAGPPAHAGNTGGPPAHAGNPDAAPGHAGNTGGPPDHANNDKGDADSADSDDDERQAPGQAKKDDEADADDTPTPTEDEEDDGNGNGPPDHANDDKGKNG